MTAKRIGQMARKQELLKKIDLDTASLVPIIALGAEILFQIIVLALSLSESANTWVAVVGNQVVFFMTCFIFTRRKGVSLVELTGVKRVPKWYLFPLFALVAVLCVFAFAPLAGLFSLLLSKMGYHYLPQYFVPFDNVGMFVLALFGLTLLPAVGEETLMRGVLLSGAKRKSPVFAIFFTALVFALFHGNLVQLVHQFLLGVVMAYLVLLTRSIWPSAVIHAFNNATALVVEYLYANEMIGGGAYGYFSANFSLGLTAGAFIGVFLASAVLLVAALVLITYLIRCARVRAGTLSAEKKGRDAVTALLAEDADREESVAPAQGVWGEYGKYIPVFLVAVLTLLLIANVISEVLK